MQLGHTSAAPSSAGILRRTAPTIETGRSPDPALEGQKIGSNGEMRAQRTHETRQSGTTAQRRRKDRTKEGPAAFLGELHDLANTRNHGTAFSPAPQRDARTLARKTKPLERQAFQGLCSYVMAER